MAEQKTEQRILLTHEEPLRTLEDYLARGGFQALKKAIGLTPMQVIDEIKRANLRGRGGAGFPTGIKWEGVYKKQADILGLPPQKYLVCNSSEGEPGTYKDRYLIKKNPYGLIEGMMIASYAVGTYKAIICIKQIFKNEIAILQRAIKECETSGYVGENVMGTGKNLPLELAFGPDSYLLGEDRAQLEVIEGKPAWPRAKGIIPVDYGLFGQPTVVNNVETLSTVPHILMRGADWFKSIGTADTPGTMIFTLTGDVNQPGVYELPMGTPLRTLIEVYGGGPRFDRHVKAVFSGPTNAVIPADKLDTPLDFGSMRKIPSGLGSGGFIVYDDTACMIKAGLNFSRFLATESCGQCASCKTGTGRITRKLEMLEAGVAGEQDVFAILDDCQHIKGQGRCFLITEEGIDIGSIFFHFPEEAAEHVQYGCLKDRPLVLPKIKDYDEATHTFIYDEEYFDRSIAEGKWINYPD
ncbi:MAG TPA: NADH-ubiquinone oxidoreductase-F iron-sulfur binding region domain-containing protein [Candidatus Manganitrophaceae bacterium]|nr:NADH-ubiquinone oxidoreductase-F iron-sulfur binding region domain-containing protein [Candidatus Manganitrophaceae bacterium]